MSTETTKKKIKIDNGTNFARAYTDKAIDAKLPTDLKATATSLSLLAGSAKIGSGINLSGFEYDEATKTLKASGGGGASVSPCLNLMDLETRSVRTFITEEELLNLQDGLYNSVLYFDASAGPFASASMGFPEPLTIEAMDIPSFSIFNLAVDTDTNKVTITGSSMYVIEISDKNADGNYPISIQKMEEATFGGGGSVDTSTLTEKNVVIVEADATEDVPFIQKYNGIYGLYRITDCSITVTNDDRDDILFVGYPLIHRDTEGIGFLVGSIYMGTHVPLTLRPEHNYSFVGTGTYKFTNGKIDATPYGCVGNMTFGGLALLAGHETTSDEITTAIENGRRSGVSYKVTLMTLKYDFKEKDDVPGPTKTFIGYVDDNTSNKLKLSGLFNGKQGTAVLEKDSSGTWVSNTPIEYAGAQETHHHTLAIKVDGRIVFAANRELESATAATTVDKIISIFSGTTTAGFGDYILLTVDTAAKLKKQDGTEVNLSTLTTTIEDIVK